jgi:hypothetical protein
MGLGPGPLLGRVFRGGCSWVERRLVGRSICWWGSTPGFSGVEARAGGWGGLARCWVLRERAPPWWVGGRALRVAAAVNRFSCCPGVLVSGWGGG